MVSHLFSLIRRKILPVALLVFLQPGLTVVENTATVNFPGSIDFHLKATGSAPITSADIEVKTDALACGDSTTKAAADKFTAGPPITADWTWQLRQTGALPPGTTITWKWDAHSSDGQTVSTPEQQVTLADKSHTWQQLTSSALILSWYTGDSRFAQGLQQAAGDGIQNLNTTLGVSDDQPIHIYIYSSSNDMQSATLYAPSWSGGLAFAQENTLLLAVAPADLTWGERAIKHELTHIIVDRHTFSCVTSTPTWFEEGLAMYFEGPPDPQYTSLLNSATRSDTLLSVRELSSILSGDQALALLSYAESESLVTFLMNQYGKDKLLALLDQWKQGSSQDTALKAVYGLDRDGLEAAWRKSIGAAPMKIVPSVSSSAITPYPTLVPLSGPPMAETEVIPTPAYVLLPTAIPVTTQPPAAQQPSSPLSNVGTSVWIIVGSGCGGLVMLVMLAVVIIRTARKPRPQEPMD